MLKIQNIFIDNRDWLANFRRIDLIKMAREHGLKVSDNTPATDIRNLIRGAGIGPDSRPKVPPQTETLKDESFTDEELRRMRIFQLRKVVKAKGIEYKKTDKKADLLAKLGVNEVSQPKPKALMKAEKEKNPSR